MKLKTAAKFCFIKYNDMFSRKDLCLIYTKKQPRSAPRFILISITRLPSCPLHVLSSYQLRDLSAYPLPVLSSYPLRSASVFAFYSYCKNVRLYSINTQLTRLYSLQILNSLLKNQRK